MWCEDLVSTGIVSLFFFFLFLFIFSPLSVGSTSHGICSVPLLAFAVLFASAILVVYRLQTTFESFYPSLYMSEDLDREKLMVSVRKRDEEEVEASSPG